MTITNLQEAKRLVKKEMETVGFIVDSDMIERVLDVIDEDIKEEVMEDYNWTYEIDKAGNYTAYYTVEEYDSIEELERSLGIGQY